MGRFQSRASSVHTLIELRTSVGFSFSSNVKLFLGMAACECWTHCQTVCTLFMLIVRLVQFLTAPFTSCSSPPSSLAHRLPRFHRLSLSYWRKIMERKSQCFPPSSALSPSRFRRPSTSRPLTTGTRLLRANRIVSRPHTPDVPCSPSPFTLSPPYLDNDGRRGRNRTDGPSTPALYHS